MTPTTTSDELIRKARAEREAIRYVQSRTSEGEFSIGVPPVAGANLGAKGSLSLRRDDVPLNHPQLVHRFRDFLGSAAQVVHKQDGKILIGIDELDRISDGDATQRFLNELKAVFNVAHCYFLVSVSEDALADFDLAAMGMRSAFDSAFDSIVRVDYLSFTEARALLNRRIVDLPESFAALAYVLSGGLARELGRTAERIASFQPTKRRSLSAVTAHLANVQLARTTRAATDRLSRVPDRRAGSVLIPVLDDPPTGSLTGDALRDYAKRVSSVGVADEDPEPVAGIRLDVTAMTMYLGVLLDVFDDRLYEDRVSAGQVGGPGDFATLARVRRYLGANPHAAIELLRSFCSTWA